MRLGSDEEQQKMVKNSFEYIHPNVFYAINHSRLLRSYFKGLLRAEENVLRIGKKRFGSICKIEPA